MRVWLAVRWEGSKLRIWPEPRVLPYSRLGWDTNR